MDRDLERIQFAQEMRAFDAPSMDERVPIVRGDSELIDHLVTKVGWLVIGLATENITLPEYAEGMALARWRLRMALLAVKSG